LSDKFGFVGKARRIVAFAGVAICLMGCAEQARISLFDEQVVDEPDFAPPSIDQDAAVLPPDEEPPLTPEVPEIPPDEEPDAEPVGEPIKEPEPGPVDAGVITGELPLDEVAVAGSALMLRYDFEGQGEMVEDRVGTAHALIRGGAALDSQGGLELDGEDDYVDMPNGVLSSQTSVTIIAWLRWRGGPCWQRIFDFGSTAEGEGFVGRARTSLFLTPASCPYGYLLSMTERYDEQRSVTAGRSMPTDRTTQVALVLDGESATSSIYIDGELEATGRNWHLMNDLDDVNNWLGRSQWIQDRYLTGRYDELRIYNRVLTDEELAEISERGADKP
jgi:hypothetical protein